MKNGHRIGVETPRDETRAVTDARATRHGDRDDARARYHDSRSIVRARRRAMRARCAREDGRRREDSRARARRRRARRCVTALGSDALESAIHAMVHDHLGCVVVLSENSMDGRPVGVATKRDALAWWLEKTPLDTRIDAVCNRPVTTASDGMSREEAASIMARARIHHLVVTTDDGAFAGVVSSWDVARSVGRQWSLPFWDEFFARVRRPRIRDGAVPSA